MKHLTPHLKALIKGVAISGAAALALFVLAPTNSYAALVPVNAGDTLSKKFPTNWQHVCEVNKQLGLISHCDLIFAGKSIDDGTGVVPAPQATPAPAPAAQPAPAAPAAPAAPSSNYVPTPNYANSGGGIVGLSTALAAPYVYGGTSPAGFDCSGLTQWLSAQRGFNIPRTSQGQMNGLRAISRGELWVGDIVVMNGGGHVGMYIGNNQIVHALNPSQGVQVMGLDYALQYNPLVGYRAVGH